MGNNHNKHFGKQQRKVLILGIQESGKTALVNTILNKPNDIQKYEATKEIQMHDIKYKIENNINLQLLLIDNAGGSRQRVFWRHNYLGTQGIVYVIDPNNEESIDESIQEYQNLLSEDIIKEIPIAVFFSKSDLYADKQEEMDKKLESFTQKIIQIGNKANHQKIEIFTGNCKQTQKLQEMFNWLLNKSIEI